MGTGDKHEPPVTCPACGTEIRREEAREYDRFGDRWDRKDKIFEYLCKPCHRESNHLPRGELEQTLVEVGTTHKSPEAFIAAYYATILNRRRPE